ncbi:MAG: hypothetical protein HYV47_02350 [Candidatus Nealsonbacteria bacterium]|nr:hypothetical protein [Candidatus Nealsonbacteria bacterium]
MVKKIVISLIAAIALFLVLAGVVFYIIKFGGEKQGPVTGEKEQTTEEKIQSITAPERTEPIPLEEQQRIEKLLKSVTAPLK